jgi:hypothetical protein
MSFQTRERVASRDRRRRRRAINSPWVGRAASGEFVEDDGGDGAIQDLADRKQSLGVHGGLKAPPTPWRGQRGGGSGAAIEDRS